MRRLLFLLALAPFACAEDPDDGGFIPKRTQIRVTPSAFLGSVPCHEGGGMETYQARLIDVTEGYEKAFALPYSKVTSCTQSLDFQYVTPASETGPAHIYIAEVVGFDRSDIEQQTPASPVVVDEDGQSVVPRWTTTCWGRDGVTPPDFSMGGAASDAESEAGGATGDLPYGVQAQTETTVVVRGCEPLEDDGEIGATNVRVDIQNSLSGLTCGTEVGEVERFTVTLSSVSEGAGGVGGAGGASGSMDFAACGEPLVVEVPGSDEYLEFEALAYEPGQTEPTWYSSCEAMSQEGITVEAGCGPLIEI